jgi:hypothetical protein
MILATGTPSRVVSTLLALLGLYGDVPAREVIRAERRRHRRPRQNDEC